MLFGLIGFVVALATWVAPGHIVVLAGPGVVLAALVLGGVGIVALVGLTLMALHIRRGTLSSLARAFFSVLQNPATEAEVPNPELVITTNDIEVLRAMRDFVRGLLANESERSQGIERKALALLSVLGVMAAFAINAASLLFGTRDHKFDSWWKVIVGLLYLFTALALAAALRRAVEAAGVVYWSRPHPDNLIAMNQTDLAEGMKLEIVGSYHALQCNTDRNNELAPAVAKAQRALMIGAVGLVALSVVVSGLALFP